jgi:type VI secretion system protein ImpJ
MHRYHRIVWSEGLFLTPQHFQQWDLYQEAQAAERAAVANPWPYGVASIEIDREDLARGVFRLLSLNAIHSNGTLIRVPDIDPAPASLPFKDAFDVRANAMDIYIGLPARKVGWSNVILPGESGEVAGEVRYAARAVSVPDENNGRNERTIVRAEQNLKILLGTDVRDAFDALPIARIARSSAGGYQLLEEYIPPLLAIKASPWLDRLVRLLLERLTARSSELAARFTEAGADARDITPANLRAFLHFAVVNGAIPILAHYKNGNAHPEDFYRFLAGLAGQLSTFNARRLHPRDVPMYEHENLGEVMTALERIVIDLLELEVSQGYVVIPLNLVGEGRYSASIPKASLMEPGSALILTVSAEDLGEPQVLSGAARIILASQDRIQQKINNRLPGLPLHHMAVPPPAIPRRRGTYYFQLDARGADWDAIRAAMNLAVDVPKDLQGAQLELLGLEGR